MKRLKLVFQEVTKEPKGQKDTMTFLLSDGGLFEVTTEKNSKKYDGEWFGMDEESLLQYMEFDKGFREFINQFLQDENSK
jgi:hypothetical protein